MKWLLIAQEEQAPPPANSSAFVCLSLIVAVVLGVVIIRWRRRLRLEQELRSIRQQLKIEYSKKYEDRKITIGIIKCSQCEWVGEWGTGMSYEQFFAGDLAEHGIYVGPLKGEKSSLSLNNRQYECPVCNSLSWKKV